MVFHSEGRFFSDWVLFFNFFFKDFFVRGFFKGFWFSYRTFSNGFFHRLFFKGFFRRLFFRMCFADGFFFSHARKVFYLLKVIFLLPVFVFSRINFLLKGEFPFERFIFLSQGFFFSKIFSTGFFTRSLFPQGVFFPRVFFWPRGCVSFLPRGCLSFLPRGCIFFLPTRLFLLSCQGVVFPFFFRRGCVSVGALFCPSCFWKDLFFCQRLFSKVCYVHIGLFQRVSFRVFSKGVFFNAFFKRFFLEFFLESFSEGFFNFFIFICLKIVFFFCKEFCLFRNVFFFAMESVVFLQRVLCCYDNDNDNDTFR